MRTAQTEDHVPWNKCEGCGQFIAFSDFDAGARRVMVTPDTEFTAESYETLCIKCVEPRR